MKNNIPAKIGILMIALIMFSIGCAPGSVADEGKTIAVAERGDLAVLVTADGNIEMPEAVNLYFDTTMFLPPYSGKIIGVYVEQGDMVKAGTLLAKMDDTTQKMAVESAQYTLELAINNVVQTVCCGTARSPSFYSDAVALLRYQFALKEVDKTRVLLQTGDYADASAQIALAKADIAAGWDVFHNPEYRGLRTEFSESGMEFTASQDVDDAMDRLTAEISDLTNIQQQLKEGQYENASAGTGDLCVKMADTYLIVKRLNHLPGDYATVDAATAYTVTREAISALDALEDLNKQDGYDPVKYAETLSTIRHDLEMSNKILDENVSTYRQGLNLKAMRDYNIAIQNAMINLEKAKQALLRTELYAPFDGEIVDVNLHSGDMITQRYSVAGAPIDTYVVRIANTSSVKFTGVLDEIDAVKMAGMPLGQVQAKIYIDAYPGKSFKGNVKSISHYGAMQSSSIQYYGTAQPVFATYNIEIGMDPADAVYMTGGLSATAEIEIDRRSGVLLVPVAALSGEAGDYTVKVVRADGTAELRQVTIGAQSGSRTEISAGLSEGEKVLIEKPVYPYKLQTTVK